MVYNKQLHWCLTTEFKVHARSRLPNGDDDLQSASQSSQTRFPSGDIQPNSISVHSNHSFGVFQNGLVLRPVWGLAGFESAQTAWASLWGSVSVTLLKLCGDRLTPNCDHTRDGWAPFLEAFFFAS